METHTNKRKSCKTHTFLQLVLDPQELTQLPIPQFLASEEEVGLRSDAEAEVWAIDQMNNGQTGVETQALDIGQEADWPLT